MNAEHVMAELRSFIVSEFLDGREDGFDTTTPLLEWGIVDSMTLVSVLAFIRDRYGVEVPDDELTPDNLRTLEAVTALVVRLSS
ncbi:acyl carrier protein [Pendulispora rubella]|uniref:Acyl carrier protein n=1 Tax=Pendulispora rubella TaxID=2741070 RepID=A0ABZ2LJ15_9BACT